MTWEGHAVPVERSEALRTDPDAKWAIIDAGRAAPESVDLDKAWHGIHWLLTGDVAGGDRPLADAIFGGEEFGEDADYGRPRWLDATRTSAVSQALTAVDVADLRDRFDPDTMLEEGIYPGIWDEEEAFDLDIAPAFEELKALYSFAAERGYGVMQWVR